jgi:thiol-disulfide isomerase/thioredoxin
MKTFMSLVIPVLWFSAVAPNGSTQETSGVGIALGKKGDNLVVNFLTPDAPAALSHAIQVGDRIIAVAQENGPDVRVKGLQINEVVRLVRGPTGTSVRLTIVPAKKDDSQAYVVSLVRGELKELAQWGDGALLKSGTKAPNISMLPLEKKTSEHLGDYVGKIIVLEFWSISCGPCQGRMADLQSYPDRYPEWKDKVVLIGASNLDVFGDTEDAVIKHVKAKGWNRIRNIRVGAEAMKLYHVNALPTVYVIDQQGKVVDSSHVLDIPKIVNRLLDDGR